MFKKKLKKKNEAFKALATLVAKATVETCLFTMFSRKNQLIEMMQYTDFPYLNHHFG